MSENVLDKMVAEYNIPRDMAGIILYLGMTADQPPTLVRAPTIEPRQTGTRAPAPSATPLPRSELEQQRPPARQVDPFWYLTNTWQVLEPTIAWPLGMYNMGKVGMTVGAGLPLRAALPKAFGGMSAKELWVATRDPTVAGRFEKFYVAKAEGKPIPRPEAKISRTTRIGRYGRERFGGGRFGGGRLGGIGVSTIAHLGTQELLGNIAVAVGVKPRTGGRNFEVVSEKELRKLTELEDPIRTDPPLPGSNIRVPVCGEGKQFGSFSFGEKTFTGCFTQAGLEKAQRNQQIVETNIRNRRQAELERFQ